MRLFHSNDGMAYRHGVMHVAPLSAVGLSNGKTKAQLHILPHILYLNDIYGPLVARHICPKQKLAMGGMKPICKLLCAR